MANILVVNSVVPYPLNFSGNTVRVLPLSRELARHHRCFLFAIGDNDGRYSALRESGVYEDVLLLPEGLNTTQRIAAYMNLRSGHRDRVKRPDYVRALTATTKDYVRRHNIDLILAHGSKPYDFLEDYRGVPKILDKIDCMSLARQRRYEHVRATLRFGQKLSFGLQSYRIAYSESTLTKVYDVVTVTSPMDRDFLASLSTVNKDRIVAIPNGVSPDLVERRVPPDTVELPNAFAFWGSLDFPPNSTAIYYFYEKVFLPYLRDQDIRWYIVGRNAEENMLRMAQKHRNIVVTGEVKDLFALVGSIPVMINPMQIGGGIKNKVLEAFALGRVVVSNTLGMEAMGATPDVHYVHADAPEQFALAIMKYVRETEAARPIGEAARRFVLEHHTWEKVSERFLGLIDELLAERRDHGVDGHGGPVDPVQRSPGAAASM